MSTVSGKLEVEADTKKRRNTIRNQWCDLPHELLSCIAQRLGLVDLLRFRVVCKDWLSASSEALANPESMRSIRLGRPWFLMYGEGSQCSLLSRESKLYKLNIPELDGATCISSSGGWILVFSQGNMFFFCPFSRAKIDLPKCPFSELREHSAAAFSSPPTSHDCIVAVIMKIRFIYLQIHLLYRGHNQWVCHEYLSATFDHFGLVTFHRGAFHIFDVAYTLVTFVVDFGGKNIEIESCFLAPKISCGFVLGFDKPRQSCGSRYFRFRKYFLANGMAKRLELESAGCSVSMSTCGVKGVLSISEKEKAALIGYNEGDSIEVFNEKIEIGKGPPSRNLKGVWIMPRYFQIPSYHSW